MRWQDEAEQERKKFEAKKERSRAEPNLDDKDVKPSRKLDDFI